MLLRLSASEYVNTEFIIAITEVDSMSCVISTPHGAYQAQYPLETLMEILRGQEPEKSNAEILKSIDKKIGNLPVFAG